MFADLVDFYLVEVVARLDRLFADLADLAFDVKDFSGGSFSGEWLFAVGDYVEAGIGAGYYKRSDAYVMGHLIHNPPRVNAEGALIAACSSCLMDSGETGWSVYWRTLLRVRMASMVFMSSLECGGGSLLVKDIARRVLQHSLFLYGPDLHE